MPIEVKIYYIPVDRTNVVIATFWNWIHLSDGEQKVFDSHCPPRLLLLLGQQQRTSPAVRTTDTPPPPIPRLLTVLDALATRLPVSPFPVPSP